MSFLGTFIGNNRSVLSVKPQRDPKNALFDHKAILHCLQFNQSIQLYCNSNCNWLTGSKVQACFSLVRIDVCAILGILAYTWSVESNKPCKLHLSETFTTKKKELHIFLCFMQCCSSNLELHKPVLQLSMFNLHVVYRENFATWKVIQLQTEISNMRINWGRML